MRELRTAAAKYLSSLTDLASETHSRSGKISMPKSKTTQLSSTAATDQSLPRNANKTPLGPNRRLPLPRIHDLKISETSASPRPRGNESFPLTARFNVPPVVAAPVPALRASKSADFANGSLSGHRLRSTDTTPSAPLPLISDKWIHDRADISPGAAPRKRGSESQLLGDAEKEKKKPKLEVNESVDFAEEVGKLIQQEMQLATQLRPLSDKDSAQRSTSDHNQTSKLSNPRKEIRSQLRGQSHRTSTRVLSRSSSVTGTSQSRPQPILRLPENSPLNNVINSASLDEEIVQARIQFNLANEELMKEKARLGQASRRITARVTKWDEKLTSLYEKRSEIKKDSDRIIAFRRDDTGENGPKSQASHGPNEKHSEPYVADVEWKKRLTLCYEALERLKPSKEVVKREEIHPATVSTAVQYKIKEEPYGEVAAPKIKGPPVIKHPTPPRRQVRFAALTAVETLL
jgi:hypothetical protein